MTRKQFKKRLGKLISAGLTEGLCPGCIAVELLAFADSVYFYDAALDSETLKIHGIREDIFSPFNGRVQCMHWKPPAVDQNRKGETLQ